MSNAKSKLGIVALMIAALCRFAVAGPEDQGTKYPCGIGIGATMVSGIVDSGGTTTFSFADAKTLGLLDANGDPKTGDNDPKPTGSGTLGGTGGGSVKVHIFKVKVKIQPKNADGTNNGDPKEVEATVCVPKKPADQTGDDDAAKAKKTNSVGTKAGANLASNFKLKDEATTDPTKNKRSTSWATVAAEDNKVPAQTDDNYEDEVIQETTMQAMMNDQPMFVHVTTAPVTMIPQAMAQFLHIVPDRTFVLDRDSHAILFTAGYINVMPDDGPLDMPTGLATVKLQSVDGNMIVNQRVAVALNPDPEFTTILLGANGLIPADYSAVLEPGPGGQSFYHLSLNPTGDAAAIIRWQSIRMHNGLGEMGIALNPAARGNGTTGPTVETRGTNVNGIGIQDIRVEFSIPVELVAMNLVSVTGQTTFYQNGVPMLGPVTTYTPMSVSMSTPTTMDIRFAPGQLPNQTCYHIGIEPVATIPALDHYSDCYIRSLNGDANGNGMITNSDILLTKSKLGQPVTPTTVMFDYNLTGTLTNSDVLYAKAQFTNPTRQALCQ